jgi:putative protein-disulfide isomerase
MKPILYYCYDAYCGWCYGFSPVIRQFYRELEPVLDFEVLSGGMMLHEPPLPIAATAAYILKAYKTVEEYTGIQFGTDYLWHIKNPEKSDWFPDSEKPAIALSVFKEIHPGLQVPFAADLQYALHYEGRDLCDKESYRHLLEKYKIKPEDFYTRFDSPVYLEKARYEFALCKQLQVSGYPAVLLQYSAAKFYMLANGYTPLETLKERFGKIMEEIKSREKS